MDRNRAERRFCWKISAELKSFKFRMMQMSKQEIYDHAYEIDCMIRIYEELVNISERLETEQLQNCMEISSLLSLVYEKCMKKLVSTLNLGKKEWLKYRKGGIGGSDAGAICGLNPYRTAIQVYNDKRTNEIEEFDNEAMREGRDLEEYVARRFVEATGKKVRRANAMFCDEENPFMLADVDRMIVGENAGLECKTASPFSAEKWEDDKIPLSYQIQCYHYMSVMNADRWYVAVLIYGTEFKVYCLERDEEMIQNLIHLENDFWNNHVQVGVIPAPDGSKLADKVLAEYFSDPVDETVELNGYQKQLERRGELKELIDKMTKEVSIIEQEIKMMMGNAERAKADNYRISWKASQRTDLDSKRMKAEEPEIYDRFKRTSISRRFVVRAA